MFIRHGALLGGALALFVEKGSDQLDFVLASN